MIANSLSIDEIRPPHNQWNNSWIQPGVVGSVGETNCSPRLRTSAPNMRIKYDPYFSGRNETTLGSNIQDGGKVGYTSGGAQARTVDSNWGGRRNFKVRHGWIMQDLRQVDKLVTPFLSSTGDYSWQNKIATNIEARRTGSQFLPLPGGYEQSPGQVGRGGSGPRVTAVVGGDMPPDSVNTSYTHEAGYRHLNASEVVGGLKHQDDMFGVPNYKPGLGRQFPTRRR